MATDSQTSTGAVPTERSKTGLYSWVNVVLAALLMLATLPGRTQGLGMITEPLLKDLHLDRVDYAQINLWATLLGAAFCLPTGYLVDRFGLRLVSATLTFLLGLVVWQMSSLTSGLVALFILITLTRAFGQSALSVVSITAVGKSFSKGLGLAMGVYSFLLSMFFVIAFGLVGYSVTNRGWRTAWLQIAVGLLFVITPLAFLFLKEQSKLVQSATVETSSDSDVSNPSSSMRLSEALKTPAFWIFGGGTALFALVSSGLGLFNEAVLAEHGFGKQTYFNFLMATTFIALLGQLICGWLTLHWPLRRLMGVGLGLYALALGLLPFIKTTTQLWTFAVLIGGAGGFITVMFFAVWSHAFGRAHLGRIQGVAQILTVLASASGPLLFAKCAEHYHSYNPVLFILTPGVLLLAIASWKVSLPKLAPTHDESLLIKPAV
ncbi:MFS transporter [Pedosphaera parvula]|uniref:Major facilitator superfamily MFS_1 n=1 Tax=Pedosphaera parvula (strain Ellin514) TaxID=320771 RepID=B9XS26_PEDPL|nr:MFS transporter [Pedosphaera parvula]EEF57358.1 major facilitator superfamily MFS_1 [Pedosphaera parvula Ellin514]